MNIMSVTCVDLKLESLFIRSISNPNIVVIEVALRNTNVHNCDETTETLGYESLWLNTNFQFSVVINKNELEVRAMGLADIEQLAFKRLKEIVNSL